MHIPILIVIVVITLMELASRAGGGGRSRTRPPGTSRPPDDWRSMWERPGGREWRPLRPGGPGSSEGGGSYPARPAPASPPGPAAQVSAMAKHTPEDERDDYLGSMGWASEEGTSMLDDGIVLGGASLLLFDDDVEDDDVAVAGSGAIGVALAALRSAAAPSDGAGAAIVLAEILGPPRAISRTGPGSSRSRWR
jgi:hypothetical protein